MITENEIRGWFKWLCDTYPCDPIPHVEIAPEDYTCVGDEGIGYGFGAYGKKEQTIYVVSSPPDELADIREEFLFTTLAHEYRHHLQAINADIFIVSDPQDYEDDADEFAHGIAWRRWSREKEENMR